MGDAHRYTSTTPYDFRRAPVAARRSRDSILLRVILVRIDDYTYTPSKGSI